MNAKGNSARPLPEGVDFRGGHLLGMTFVVEEDEAFGPIVVTIFGTNGVMADATGRTEPVEQFRLRLGCLCGEVGDHMWNRNCVASACQTNCVWNFEVPTDVRPWALIGSSSRFREVNKFAFN